MHDDITKRLVILRMNREFIEHMSNHYAKEILGYLGSAYVPVNAVVAGQAAEINEDEALDLPCDLPLI